MHLFAFVCICLPFCEWVGVHQKCVPVCIRGRPYLRYEGEGHLVLCVSLRESFMMDLSKMILLVKGLCQGDLGKGKWTDKPSVYWPAVHAERAQTEVCRREPKEHVSAKADPSRRQLAGVLKLSDPLNYLEGCFPNYFGRVSGCGCGCWGGSGGVGLWWR